MSTVQADHDVLIERIINEFCPRFTPGGVVLYVGDTGSKFRRVFEGSTAPLVLVTAFMTRQAMARYFETIAWETEAWVAEAPSHMIHFNGERFLGPYPSIPQGK